MNSLVDWLGLEFLKFEKCQSNINNSIKLIIKLLDIKKVDIIYVDTILTQKIIAYYNNFY